MEVFDALNRLYHDMTLHELRLMNANKVYPNITHNSLLYLDLISYKENCTVSYLAEILGVSKPAVTIKVNELIKQGFVIKKQSEKDKRVFYLSISPAVEKEYRQYDKRLMRMSQILTEQYREDEIALFKQMIELLRVSYLEEPE